jgi:hypothetical protein
MEVILLIGLVWGVICLWLWMYFRVNDNIQKAALKSIFWFVWIPISLTISIVLTLVFEMICPILWALFNQNFENTWAGRWYNNLDLPAWW